MMLHTKLHRILRTTYSNIAELHIQILTTK
jgi:hypothetical protein